LRVGLIGCTNSSYEDIARAASIAKQIKIKIKSKFTITRGSEVVRYTIERDGFIITFDGIGATILRADHVSGMWTEEQKKRRREQSFTLSTVTSPNVPMEIQTLWLS
jgi:aconitate hydratase